MTERIDLNSLAVIVTHRTQKTTAMSRFDSSTAGATLDE